MGTALTALSDTKSLLQHNPIIAAAGWGSAVLSAVAGFVLGILPGGSFLASTFVGPLFLTGMLGLVYAGRNGDASVSDFVDSVTGNYVAMVGGSILTGALVIGLTVQFVAAVMSFVAGGSTLAAIGMGSTAGTGGAGGAGATGGMASGLMGALGIVFLVALLLVFVLALVLAMSLQFFDAAIVVDGESPFGALERSWTLFKDAPVSVFGYSLVRFGFYLLLVGFPVVILLLIGAGLEASSIVGLAGLAVVGVLLFPVAYFLDMTYHVAYYNRQSGAS